MLENPGKRIKERSVATTSSKYAIFGGAAAFVFGLIQRWFSFAPRPRLFLLSPSSCIPSPLGLRDTTRSPVVLKPLNRTHGQVSDETPATAAILSLDLALSVTSPDYARGYICLSLVLTVFPAGARVSVAAWERATIASCDPFAIQSHRLFLVISLVRWGIFSWPFSSLDRFQALTATLFVCNLVYRLSEFLNSCSGYCWIALQPHPLLYSLMNYQVMII